jgi:hypothetical protein
MRVRLLISFLVILVLAFPSLAAKAPNADLTLSLIAIQSGQTAQEVNPNSTFSYNISIKNNDPTNPAEDAVLTIKLPYNARYVGALANPAQAPDYSLRQSGDMLVVAFQSLPPKSQQWFNITMIAPDDPPDTLYAIANIRYGGDPNTGNNRATLSTYVPLPGYDQSAAAKSMEDLLHNQTDLLFTFQDLLMRLPQGAEENYNFTVSFEQLLRSQAALTSSFQELLANDTRRGWDSYYSSEDRTYLLNSTETLLREEADLFAGFSSKINDSWQSLDGYVAPGHSMDAQWELLASLEDLLKRQVRLYKGFVYLLHEIDQGAPPQERQALVKFLASYEDLLRRESNLIAGFENLMTQKFAQTGRNSWEEYSRVQPAIGSDWSIY